MPRQHGDFARLAAEARAPGRRRRLCLRRIPIIEVGQSSAAVVEHEDRAKVGGKAILERPGDGFAAARGKLRIAEEGGAGLIFLSPGCPLHPGKNCVNITRLYFPTYSKATAPLLANSYPRVPTACLPAGSISPTVRLLPS